MRRTVLSQKTIRPSKQPSRESQNSSKKLRSTIDDLHSYLSNVNVGHVGCDFEWLLEQEQILARLSTKLKSQQHPQDEYRIKLRSCESILQNMRSRITQIKLGALEVPMTSSTTHQTSCDGRARQKTVPVGYSVEKLKHTVPCKPSLELRSAIDGRTPCSELASDYDRKSAIKDKDSKEGTYHKFKKDPPNNKLRSALEIEQPSLERRNKVISESVADIVSQPAAVTRLTRKCDELKLELRQQQFHNAELQSQMLQTTQELRQASQEEASRLKVCLATLQKESDSLKNQNTRLVRENEYLIAQTNKHSDTIAQLNQKIIELEQQLSQLDNSTREGALISHTHRQIEEKQAIIRQLIYEKENYSDGYAQLRKEKMEHLENIRQLEAANSDLKRQLSDLQSTVESLKEQITEIQDSNALLENRVCSSTREKQEMECTVRDLRMELRENRLELRTAEQKAELFQERYYKLRQNSTEEEELIRTLTQKDLSRSSKLITQRAVHEKSTERDDQGRRIKALTELKVMVKTHRLNITSGLR